MNSKVYWILDSGGRPSAGKGLNLVDYQIDPMNPTDTIGFLQNNSQLHDEMNGALGLVNIDLQEADLSEEKQLKTWIDLHYLEHYNAESKIGA